MKETYEAIVKLLSSELGRRLEMSADRISYHRDEDPGEPIEGYKVGGYQETISIPDEYMDKARVLNASDFLNWLKSQ